MKKTTSLPKVQIKEREKTKKTTMSRQITWENVVRSFSKQVPKISKSTMQENAAKSSLSQVPKQIKWNTLRKFNDDVQLNPIYKICTKNIKMISFKRKR